MTNVKRFTKLAKPLREFLSFKVRSEDFQSYVKGYFQALDTPVSLSCWLLYQHGEHGQLVAKDIDPAHYCDAQSFKLDLAAISLLRKYQDLSTGIDTQEAALSNFRKSEVACRETNVRFKDLAFDPQFKGPNVWLLNAMTRKIASILKDGTKEEFFANGAWGPGATASITGNNTSAVRKFRYENEITSRLYPIVSNHLSVEYPLWFSSQEEIDNLVIRDWSKVLTVPKNAKTDRAIAVEPGLNSWFQKSIGLMIRKRLRKAGYDLNDSSRGQLLAQSGSKTGLIATVDFSSASDTISYHMVREVIPYSWWQLLESCRTPCYKLPGDQKTSFFEKFSSMGNGFTFELESLIFIAAAEAVTEYLGLEKQALSVHGDDITIDSRGFELYKEFTKFLGFTVNVDKSFGNWSPFRESCGSFFFNGVDVKPLFLKERIHDAKGIFRLANGVTRVAHSYRFRDGRDIRFRPLHNALVASLPESSRILGPLTSGDICIASDFDEATPTVVGDGWEGYFHPAFIDVPVELESDSRAVLLTRLWYGSSEMAYKNKFSLRSVTSTRYKKRVLVPLWYSLGPWT